MSLRIKIGMILSIAVAGFCLVQFLIQQCVILPGFLSLEKQEALKNAHRVEAAIQNEIHRLETLCADWSSWDDMYHFAQFHSEAFINTNLVFSTFSNNGLNLIFICDPEGRVIWGRIYDLEDQSSLNLSLFSSEKFDETHPLFQSGSDPGAIRFFKKGMLITEKGPLLLAARPILTSNDGGPLRGICIMGKFFNEDMRHYLQWQTQVEYAVFTKNEIDQATEIKSIIDPLLAPGAKGPVMDETEPGWMKVYSVFPDINGNPALILISKIKRDIAHKGRETVRIAVYSVLLAGLGILVLVLIGFKKTILKPLDHLTRHAVAIRQSGEFSKRLSFTRNDEIGVLSREFDNMLAFIERTSRNLEEAKDRLEKDMKARLDMLASLKESEERFNAMIDQAMDAVFVNTRDGRIRMVNRVACSRLGYDQRELLEMNLFDIDPDFLHRIDHHDLCHALGEKKPILFEAKHYRKNGTYFPVEVSVSPIQYKGEDLFLSIARDISRRKEMELHLRHADKMSAIQTLTGGIAHNFNNILSVISGSAGLAKQYIPENSPGFNLIQKIETASMRAREIVWQLISFSNPSNDYLTPLPIHQVIGDIVEKLETSKPENIRVTKYIQPDCHPVMGNINHFYLVMKHIWENAVEALSHQGGQIDIQVENISLAAIPQDMGLNFKPGEYVRILVKDNGCGIDTLFLENIFDPYFTTKDFSAGAGMGLSVVHGIVNSLGGFIRVHSKPGQGTCITLLFPSAKEFSENHHSFQKSIGIKTK